MSYSLAEIREDVRNIGSLIRMEYVSTSEQVLTSGALTQAEFDTIILQADNGEYTGNTTTGGITISTAGVYSITAGAALRIVSGASRRFIGIRIGSTIISNLEGQTGNGAEGVSTATVTSLAVNDVVNVAVVATGTTCTLADAATSNLCIVRLR